ncbi:unnamed protein product [Gadus morhua 'NCC']
MHGNAKSGASVYIVPHTVASRARGGRAVWIRVWEEVCVGGDGGGGGGGGGGESACFFILITTACCQSQPARGAIMLGQKGNCSVRRPFENLQSRGSKGH